MQASSIVASVAISCFLSTVLDFFKDNSNNFQISETKRSEINDLESRVLSHEKWIHEILQGNITSLETELTKTKDAAMGECQKVTEYLQTNKTEVLALQERQKQHHQLIEDQNSRLHVKDKALADLERKLDDMQNQLLQYRETESGQINTAEPSTSLEQLIQKSQAYLPITVFLLTVGELVLFLILVLSRRKAITVPSESGVKPDTQKNSRGKRQRKEH